MIKWQGGSGPREAVEAGEKELQSRSERTRLKRLTTAASPLPPVADPTSSTPSRCGAGDDAGAQVNPPASLNRARVAAYELITMAAIPGTALALAWLNVFDALVHAGDDALLTAPELAALALSGKRADLTNLTRLLRMMAATKILREVMDEDERRFALTPVGCWKW